MARRWRLGRRGGRGVALGTVVVLVVVGILMIDVANHRRPPAAPTSSFEAIGESPMSGDVAAETAVADLPVDINVRVGLATQAAADRGSEVSILIVDRSTGETISNGDDTAVASASVSKLFIADDLLTRDGSDITLPADDREMLDVMLQSSDDSAAQVLWDNYGGSEMIERVAQRYGLTGTWIDPDEPWWMTMVTPSDLATFYGALLDGRGGLPADRANQLLADLATFTDTGADGYDQRFGLPDGLPNEHMLAVKQGWMCCVNMEWLHLSTGLAGVGFRYVIILVSRESVDAAGGGGDEGAEHARETITRVTQLLFPGGRTGA